MAETFRSRFKNAWNAFTSRDSYDEELTAPLIGSGWGNSYRPHRRIGYTTNKNSIIDPIYNRIGIDVSSVTVRHVRVDENGRFSEELNTYLNECLTLEANIDQASIAFFRDAVMTLCESGAIAIVPVESKGNPFLGDNFDPISLRVGYITQWYAKHVRVRLYNDQTALYEERLLPKRMTAIVENPLYSVMNEPNSILQRLLDKLRLLDVMDEQNSSGKLDLIIQLPYVLKSAARKEQAENRRKDIEDQLVGSKYGIAYTDGTERITQLNRPAENNLMVQVEYLTNMLYSQLGITQEIVNGTADEAAMINYFNRTVEPFLSAITQAMTRTFVSRTARAQGQRVMYYRDPFKLVPVSTVAEIADKFTRNEIMSANEIRSAIGMLPSSDPKADELRNSNLSRAKEETPAHQELDIAEAEQDFKQIEA